MNKFIKGISVFAFGFFAVLGFSGCGNNEIEIFKHTSFSNTDTAFVKQDAETAQLAFEGNMVVIPKSITGQGFFTKFGDYRNEFPTNGYATSVTVYIDPSVMLEGEGFSFTSAINNKSGTFLTEQMTHIRKISPSEASGTNAYEQSFDYSEFAGKVLISTKAGILNTQFTNPYNNEMEYSTVEIKDAGFYTISTTYSLNNDQLVASSKIMNDKNVTIYEATPDLGNGDLNKENLGGNRYGWFSFNSLTDGLKVKELKLTNK